MQGPSDPQPNVATSRLTISDETGQGPAKSLDLALRRGSSLTLETGVA